MRVNDTKSCWWTGICLQGWRHAGQAKYDLVHFQTPRPWFHFECRIPHGRQPVILVGMRVQFRHEKLHVRSRSQAVAKFSHFLWENPVCVPPKYSPPGVVITFLDKTIWAEGVRV